MWDAERSLEMEWRIDSPRKAMSQTRLDPHREGIALQGHHKPLAIHP